MVANYSFLDRLSHVPQTERSRLPPHPQPPCRPLLAAGLRSRSPGHSQLSRRDSPLVRSRMDRDHQDPPPPSLLNESAHGNEAHRADGHRSQIGSRASGSAPPSKLDPPSVPARSPSPGPHARTGPLPTSGSGADSEAERVHDRGSWLVSQGRAASKVRDVHGIFALLWVLVSVVVRALKKCNKSRCSASFHDQPVHVHSCMCCE